MHKHTVLIFLHTLTLLLHGYNMQGSANNDVTVVVAYYEIPSKFPKQKYHEWAKNLLPHLQCNLIVHCGHKNHAWLSDLCKHNNKTHFVITEFEDLFFQKNYGKDFWGKQYGKDAEKYHSPQLYVIWAQKVVFLQDAITSNPFNTSKFVYMDIGCIRDVNMIPYLATFPNSSTIPNNKILMEIMQPFLPNDPLFDIHTWHNIRIAGTFIAGSSAALRFFIQQYFEVFRQYLEKDLFVGRDQNLFNTIYKLNPDMFQLVSSANDASYKYDPWFYMVAYLSK